MTSKGVYQVPAHKDSGSRHNGWELLRERLKNVMKPDGPRLFVFNQCRQFIRMVPAPPRDEVDMDDVDSRAEDHVGEETRYRLPAKAQVAVTRQIRGGSGTRRTRTSGHGSFMYTVRAPLPATAAASAPQGMHGPLVE